LIKPKTLGFTLHFKNICRSQDIGGGAFFRFLLSLSGRHLNPISRHNEGVGATCLLLEKRDIYGYKDVPKYT
jgi:hypothetical protein